MSEKEIDPKVVEDCELRKAVIDLDAKLDLVLNNNFNGDIKKFASAAYDGMNAIKKNLTTQADSEQLLGLWADSVLRNPASN